MRNSEARKRVEERTPGQWTVDADGIRFRRRGTGDLYLTMRMLHHEWQPFADADDAEAAYEALAAALNAADTDLPPGVGRIAHTDGELADLLAQAEEWIGDHHGDADASAFGVLVIDLIEQLRAVRAGSPPGEPRTEPAEVWTQDEVDQVHARAAELKAKLVPAPLTIPSNVEVDNEGRYWLPEGMTVDGDRWEGRYPGGWFRQPFHTAYVTRRQLRPAPGSVPEGVEVGNDGRLVTTRDIATARLRNWSWLHQGRWYPRTLLGRAMPMIPANTVGRPPRADTEGCPECGASGAERCQVVGEDGRRTGIHRFSHKARTEPADTEGER